jgi:hypothetical protein
LGGRSKATEAGNLVLYAVEASNGLCHDGKARFYSKRGYHYLLNSELPEAASTSLEMATNRSLHLPGRVRSRFVRNKMGWGSLN